MNAELLLEHFHRLGDAPDAVPRLRRFILDLAVRGKLVEQDEREVPAIKFIAEHIRPGSSGKRAYANESSQEEGPFTVPSGWEWLRFGDVHDLVRGVTYTKSDVSESPQEGHLPVLRANNIGDGLNFDELVYVKSHCISEEQILRQGDFLLALSSGSKNLVGKAAYVKQDYPGAFGGFCGVVRLCTRELEPYVGVFLVSPFYREAIAAGSRGIGINNLKRETLNNIWFPIPPLPEQHRIVAKVEELMALCDRLEAAQQQREAERTRLTAAAWQAVVQAEAPAEVSFALEQLSALTTRPAQVKALRQIILDLAVRGRLVEQEEGDGSGAETLAEVKRLRKELVEERRIRGGKDTEYVDAILDVPASWATPYVADVAIVLGGKRIPKGLTFSESPTPHIYIRVTDMKDGTIRTEGLKYITPEVQRTIAQYTINKEDLYITIAGTIGSVGRVPEFFDGHNLTENAAKIVFRGIDPDYFRMALSTQQVQDQFTDKIKQMAQPKLAIKRVMGSRFPLPPLAEQRRIVAKVEELMALCDGLDAALESGEALRGKVLEAVLAGELEYKVAVA